MLEEEIYILRVGDCLAPRVELPLLMLQPCPSSSQTVGVAVDNERIISPCLMQVVAERLYRNTNWRYAISR